MEKPSEKKQKKGSKPKINRERTLPDARPGEFEEAIKVYQSFRLRLDANHYSSKNSIVAGEFDQLKLESGAVTKAERNKGMLPI